MRRVGVQAGWLAAIFGTGAFGAPQVAEACGCFAPPNPATPVVQSGEQIVFAVEDGKVTMHVRVQYRGAAEEFGWLLPLPEVPQLDVGTEALFLALQQRTRPRFRLVRNLEGDGCFTGVDAGAGVGFSGDAGLPPPSSGGGPDDVLVRRESVGPYDAAVLRADNLDAMQAWLRENRFFVPALDGIVDPYVRPGAYFLALKLLSGRDAGDIAPIVLQYESDLPMIPMTLTQMGADANMPVTVYVLGEARAIPRNFRHTVINHAHIQWFDGGRNYEDVVTAAVDEATDRHSFVTEFAADTAVMVDVLDGPQKFGLRETLARITDPREFVRSLRARQFIFTTTLVDILRASYPFPDAVRASGVDEDTWYANLEWFLGPYRANNPDQFDGVVFEIDAPALSEEMWTRIVEPARRAGQLFRDHAKLTRLFTTLSPEEMTKDPVFSFNPTLPDVSNVHTAIFMQRCEAGQPPGAEGSLELPDGRTFRTSAVEWGGSRAALNTPFSERIEILREEGAPRVEVDNRDLLGQGDGASGMNPKTGALPRAEGASSCTSTGPGAVGGLGLLLLGLAVRRRPH